MKKIEEGKECKRRNDITFEWQSYPNKHDGVFVWDDPSSNLHFQSQLLVWIHHTVPLPGPLYVLTAS